MGAEEESWYSVAVRNAAHDSGTKFYELILLTPMTAAGVANVPEQICIQRNGPIKAQRDATAGQHRVLGRGHAAQREFVERTRVKERDGYPLSGSQVTARLRPAEVVNLLNSHGHTSLADSIFVKSGGRYEPPESRETVKQAEDIPRIIPHNYGGW